MFLFSRSCLILVIATLPPANPNDLSMHFGGRESVNRQRLQVLGSVILECYRNQRDQARRGVVAVAPHQGNRRRNMFANAAKGRVHQHARKLDSADRFRRILEEAAIYDGAKPVEPRRGAFGICDSPM